MDNKKDQSRRRSRPLLFRGQWGRAKSKGRRSVGGSCERAAKQGCAREGVCDGNSGIAVSDNSFSEAKHMLICKVTMACKQTKTRSHTYTHTHWHSGREMSVNQTKSVKSDSSVSEGSQTEQNNNLLQEAAPCNMEHMWESYVKPFLDPEGITVCEIWDVASGDVMWGYRTSGSRCSLVRKM